MLAVKNVLMGPIGGMVVKVTDSHLADHGSNSGLGACFLTPTPPHSVALWSN